MQEIIQQISLFTKQYSVYINSEELLTFFDETISNIGKILTQILDESPWIIGIYVAIVLLLILIAHKTHKNFISSKSITLHEIDKVLYKIALITQKEKNNIYDFPNTIKILYNNQQKILTDIDSNFIYNFEDLDKDIKYIEKLLKITILKDDQKEKIETLIDITKKIRMLYIGLMSLIAIMTLGIGNIFQKSTKI